MQQHEVTDGVVIYTPSEADKVRTQEIKDLKERAYQNTQERTDYHRSQNEEAILALLKKIDSRLSAVEEKTGIKEDSDVTS